MKHLANKMALFSIVWKKIGQITHLSICNGINDTQVYMNKSTTVTLYQDELTTDKKPTIGYSIPG